MNLELALVELYLSGHICPLSMLRVNLYAVCPPEVQPLDLIILGDHHSV